MTSILKPIEIISFLIQKLKDYFQSESISDENYGVRCSESIGSGDVRI